MIRMLVSFVLAGTAALFYTQLSTAEPQASEAMITGTFDQA